MKNDSKTVKLPKTVKPQKPVNLLNENDFIIGCHFQIRGGHEKNQLYISEYNENNNLILLDYDFACLYGKDVWRNISDVFFHGPEFFIFQYRVFGELETVKRY